MSAHKLFRLITEVYNTPQLITPKSFEVILNYLDHRNSPQFLMPMQGKDDTEEDLPDDMDDFDESPMPVTVIDICGSLTYKPVMTLCGEVGTSYKGLIEQVEGAIEMGATTIIFNLASGGGEAAHCFETCEEIRKICDESEVSLIGYIDEQACSACYAIAVICDELYANPSADIGSIGCVISLLDTSKAMEMEGYKRIYISSGTNKVPFADDGTFKQEFLDSLQVSVDKLNEQFANHVSKYTGLDTKTIKGFEASVFDADESLSKGLINGVMTNREFVKYIVNKQGASGA